MANRDYMRNAQTWRIENNKTASIDIVSKDKTYYCFVNPSDVSKVSKYRWYLKDGYAVTSIKYKRVKMHHLIIGKPKGKDVTDHINRVRTDNRLSNLRHVKQLLNMKNMFGRGCRKRGQTWDAQIQVNGKQKHLGTYKTEEEAHQAYLSAKIIYHTI